MVIYGHGTIKLLFFILAYDHCHFFIIYFEYNLNYYSCISLLFLLLVTVIILLLIIIIIIITSTISIIIFITSTISIIIIIIIIIIFQAYFGCSVLVGREERENGRSALDQREVLLTVAYHWTSRN